MKINLNPFRLSMVRWIWLCNGVSAMLGRSLLLAFILTGTLAQAQEKVVNILGANGKFVVAEGDQVTVNVNRQAAGPWEKWQMLQSGNVVTLRSVWGKYLSAQPNGTLQANRGAVGDWEKFLLVDVGNGAVAFQTIHKTFLAALPNGSLGTSAKVGPANNFLIKVLQTVNPAAAATPSPPTSPPTSTGRLTPANVEVIVAWMAKEYLLYETPACWTKSYDRGIGIAPKGCSGGKSLENTLCYDNCRSGYVSDGATTCASVCPSGYKASGIATCTWDESNGGKSYVPDPAYDQGEQCSRWDEVDFGRLGKSRTCGATSRKACRAGEHREGLNCRKDCRAGYKETAGVCYLDKPWDVSRNTYTRGSGTVQDACLSNRKFENGLCYQIANAGYSCKVATCNQNCPSGLQACGSAAACGKDEESCATAITDMAVAPALMVAGAFTGGGLKVAGSAGKVAAKQASKTLKAALENAKTANDAKDAAFILKSAVENLQKIGEADIAALSNQEIASEIESHYKPGSDEFKAIGRRWAQVVAAINARIFQIELHKFVSGMADSTGILGTIYAFDKPKCGDHVPFPR